jgi:hypothetical protein
MSDQHQQSTLTTLTDAAARCRAVVERHSPYTSDNQRSLSDTATAALAAPIRQPHRTILALGIVFVTVGTSASFVTSGVGEAVQTAVFFGAVSFGGLLLAADHRQRSYGDESAENCTHRTSTTTEETNHD